MRAWVFERVRVFVPLRVPVQGVSKKGNQKEATSLGLPPLYTSPVVFVSSKLGGPYRGSVEHPNV